MFSIIEDINKKIYNINNWVNKYIINNIISNINDNRYNN